MDPNPSSILPQESILPSRPSKGIQDIQVFKPFQGKYLQASRGFHPIPAFSKQNAYSTILQESRVPTQSAGFHRKLHQVPVETFYKTFNFKEMEMLWYQLFPIALRSSNMLTTIHSFSSKQWLTQRQCVYELSYWHNAQLISVNCIKNSQLIFSCWQIS